MTKQRHLTTTLIAVVAGLVAAACDEKERFFVRPISLTKACELAKRRSPPTEDECEDLCGNGDVDECSLSVAAANSGRCTAATPEEGAVFANGLECIVKYLEPANPFASTTMEGRRPESFTRSTGAVVDLGSYFAACSELEAASVDAFERLARELEAFGAPPGLVARARRARRDEVRHARWTAALARAHGVTPPSVPPAPLTVRSLFDMALENAVEGVVRETVGAAQALYRAAMTRDARTSRTMRKIAEDELGHAELSWDICAYTLSRLGDDDRKAIALAMLRELARLEQPAVTLAPSLGDAAGVPDDHIRRQLVATVRELIEGSGALAAA